MKTFVITPVRTTSSRMRGKIFWPFIGKSMLQHFIERVQRAKLIDGVAIACPPKDLAEFAEFTKDWGIEVVAPDLDESDLIGRLYQAGKTLAVDIVIRICADNPCVESEQIDRLIDWKYLTEGRNGRPWTLPVNSERFADHFSSDEFDGFGGELYSLEMLEWMNRVIKDSEYREHPHLIWKTMERTFYCGKMYPKGFRLDVNTEQEYQKLKKIYDHFGHNQFTVKEVMEYLAHKQESL